MSQFRVLQYPQSTKIIDPTTAWVNQGGATWAASEGGMLLTAPASGSLSARCRVVAVPATPWVKTVSVSLNAAFQNTVDSLGLLFRESGTGELHSFGIGYSSGLYLLSGKWNSATSYSANYAVFTGFTPVAPRIWLRIADDGVNRICSYSLDNISYLVFHSVGRTDFLTADQWGFMNANQNSSFAAYLQAWTLD